jgi:hypothetical protein
VKTYGTFGGHQRRESEWRKRPCRRRMPGNLATLLWILVLACAQASKASDLLQREPPLGLQSVSTVHLLFTHVGPAR